MADDLTQEQRTNAIERVYNRAVNEALAVLEKARIEAKTYLKFNEVVESQQAYIERLTKLHGSLQGGAQNPLGDFNWDWL